MAEVENLDQLEDLKEYTGSYQVTPAISKEQVLPTENTAMSDDVTVFKIPKVISGNASTGLTVRFGTDNVPPVDQPASSDGGTPVVTPQRMQLTSEFGYVKEYPEIEFFYEGDGESGVRIVIEAYGAISRIRVNNATRGEYIILDTDKIKEICDYTSIRKYDIITIDTHKGSKSITLDRGFKTYNIMHAMSSDSKWIYIQPGPNILNCTVRSGAENIRVFVDYDIRLLGV